jgi:hypothetical protein
MCGLSGCGMLRVSSAWIKTALTSMYGHMSLKFPSAYRESPLTDLNSTPGRTIIKRSVDVLLKRRVHV